MQISVEGNFRGINKFLNVTKKQLQESLKNALSITAQDGVRIIKERTAKGEGYKGKFAPYSKGYAELKANGWKAGTFEDDPRSFSGDASRVVNLFVRGAMLGGMATTVDNEKATIYFTTGELSKRAAKNDKTRPFFGFNAREQTELGKTFIRYMK